MADKVKTEVLEKSAEISEEQKNEEILREFSKEDMMLCGMITGSSVSTTFHGGRKNYHPARNMSKPGRHWSG